MYIVEYERSLCLIGSAQLEKQKDVDLRLALLMGVDKQACWVAISKTYLAMGRLSLSWKCAQRAMNAGSDVTTTTVHAALVARLTNHVSEALQLSATILQLPDEVRSLV